MGIEIERKFLLKNDDWTASVIQHTSIKQGYLNTDIERTVRVRTYGLSGVITIKGKVNGLTRPEFEYEIPYEDAVALLTLCEQPIIEKVRHKIKQGKLFWEIDVFEGDNQGLVVAEIELESENQEFDKPDWLGEEVSDDDNYYNSSLLKNPYKLWCVNKTSEGEELVSFDQAIELKGKGFNLETKYYYQNKDLPFIKKGLHWGKNGERMNHNQYNDYIYSVPTVDVANAWFEGYTVMHPSAKVLFQGKNK